MLRLRPDRLDILLQPTVVSWRRYSGWRGQSIAQGVLPCAPSADRHWLSSLSALAQIIKTQPEGSAAVTLVLSNYFVRYAILPWRHRLYDIAERMEYARHHFRNIYGDTVDQWMMRVSGIVAGRAHVASAVDSELITGLEQIFRDTQVRLHSIQPLFMHAYNYWCSDLKGHAVWFAVAEPGKLCLGLMAGGTWQRIRSHLMRESVAHELHHIIEQEALVMDPKDANAPVYLYAPEQNEVSFPAGSRWAITCLASPPAQASRLFGNRLAPLVTEA